MDRDRLLHEARQREAAMREILRIIGHSPSDPQAAFDAILDNAIRLCEASLGALFVCNTNHLELVAHKGMGSELTEMLRTDPVPLDPEQSVLGRAAVERRVIQVEDLLTEPLYGAGQRHRRVGADREGMRTQLCVPLYRGAESVGVIVIYRREVRRFEEDHVELISAFADQALIAVDNVHRFRALEAALERQNATSEVLRVISHSPTDYQPVFDAILENASRICRAPLGELFLVRDGHLHVVASKGARPEFRAFMEQHPVPLDAPAFTTRSATEGIALQTDRLDDADYDAGQPHRVAAVDIEGIRTLLCVPMRKDGAPVGVITLYRRERRLFEPQDIEILETFADQAVIAIENVRLFLALEARSAELTRSVGELRALGEVGRAVSSSLDLETVLTTIIEQAVGLSGADGGAISEYDEDTGTLPMRAAPGFTELLAGEEPPRLGEGAIGRAAETRAPVRIPDVEEPGAYTGRLRHVLSKAGLKALLAVPLLREGRVLGALLVARKKTGAFPAETVELLGSFAAQSALAIHNARLFRALEEQGRELETANRHKSEFLANMSHELRTPLNAVIGFSEVLGDEMFGDLNEKQAEYVDDIHTSGRHLLSLINDILDLAKVEAGHMGLGLSRFEIGPALGNALTLVRERASSRGLTLTAAIEEPLGEMTGDERKLKQILLNLLSNAIKFTPAGGQVTLAATRRDDTLEIAVRDTGVGISAEDQALVFEAFRQAGGDYARKTEGTGLGLTLTRRFVELHGGEISVESAPGEGSVFHVTLPTEPRAP